MILLGDPAVRLFGAPKADLEINDDQCFCSNLSMGSL